LKIADEPFDFNYFIHFIISQRLAMMAIQFDTANQAMGFAVWHW